MLAKAFYKVTSGWDQKMDKPFGQNCFFITFDLKYVSISTNQSNDLKNSISY